MRRYEAFTITGVANDTAWDDGLAGTEGVPKKLLGLLLCVTGHAGNLIKLDRERKTLLTLYDYHIDTDEDSGGANTLRSTSKMQWVDCEADVGVGVKVQVGIACGATAKNLFGAYVYEEK